MTYSPADVGRAHALQFLAVHCDDRAEDAERAYTRAARDDDRAYLRALSQTLRRTAERLRNSPGFRLAGEPAPVSAPAHEEAA